MTTLASTPPPPSPATASHPAAPAPVVPTSLAEFLVRHPWSPEWLALGTPIEHFWVVEVPMPKEALWPHLSDTSTMNQRLGLPEMKFVERDGKTYGSQVRGGSKMEWEEVPWEWDYERGLQNARIYATGALRYLRARFEVHERGADACAVVIYFGGLPRNWIGRLALRFGMSSLGADLRRVFLELAESFRGQGRTGKLMLLPRPEPPPLAPDARQRLSDVHAALLAAGTSREIADRIETFAITSTEDELARIRVRSLAQSWKIPERELLVAFLRATRSGLFTLSWDAVCPHCRGPRAELLHLGELPQTASCGPCGIEFDATQMNSLEVSFHIHPAIRQTECKRFCAAEPARKPHILFQRSLGPGERIALPMGLGEGRYRLRIRGSKEYLLLDLRAGAAGSEVYFGGSAGADVAVAAPQPTLRLENPALLPATFILERRDEDALALRPSELFALQEFRDLFSEESIAADVQLDIGMQTILFTDLVGSTRYYEEVGDAKAFGAVRRHFLKAYDCVKRNRGVVVKTIGDAVMAAFQDPAGAVQAAVELQRIFDGKNSDSTLRLRATIHVGRCLAVSLNSNIDYFGSTVNLAAKLQSIAEAGELVFTQSVREDPGVRELLVREGFAVATVPFEMKWSGGSLEALRIDISGNRAAT